MNTVQFYFKTAKLLLQFTKECFSDFSFKKSIRIYIAGTLSGSSEGLIADPSGYVTDVNHYKVMVFDATQSWDWDYTVNQEISHMIDRSPDYRSTYQQDSLYSEETWESYNPINFEYLYTYDDYQYNADYEVWPEELPWEKYAE